MQKSLKEILNMKRKVIIGSRGSALALWQAGYIAKRLKEECNLESEIKTVKTRGDKILDAPLAKIGGKGLFTKELEELLLDGEIDLAVHSLKDVPVVFPDGLRLCAITQREDVRDCFLSFKYPSLKNLPQGAKVGTTSLRRSMQLKAIRKDLDTQSLRGNVQTRLERLERGEFDAIILACAGVKRLEINQVPHIVPLEIEEMIPAMGQGALGLECRIDSEFCEEFRKLNCEDSQIFCESEREFVACLEGGCQVPIGVHSLIKDSKLCIIAKIGLPNGEEIMQSQISGEIGEHLKLARELASEFIDKGAKELLARACEVAFV